MERKRGISLIVLVITILVMIILAGVVVVTMTENNPIDKAKEASFKGDVSSFSQELSVAVANKMSLNANLSVSDVQAEGYANIKGYIDSFSRKYANKFVITDAKLVYTGKDKKEQKWAMEAGIAAFAEVNMPEITNGMLPVKFANGKWVVCTKEDPEWYNYAEKRWANVMLLDGKCKEGTPAGTVVEEGNLGSMFVWIPRYAYSITSYKTPKNGEGMEQQIMDVKFLVGTSSKDLQGEMYKKDYDNLEAKKGLATPYIVHPAFTFGEKELSGFWMAKFESSRLSGNNNDNASCDNTNGVLKILPNKNTWRHICMRNILAVCMDMSKEGNIYGLANADTHLVKNSEWGAASYLAASKYGYIPTINKEKLEIAAGEKYEQYSGGNNYIANANQSTTGNVTGIYDMNGGAWDYTAAFWDNENENLQTYGGDRFFAGNKLKKEYAKYFDSYKVSADEIQASKDKIWNLGESANARRRQMTLDKIPLMQEKKGDGMYEAMQDGKFSYFAKRQSGEDVWFTTNITGTSNEYESLLYNGDYALVGNTLVPFIPRGGRFWSGEKSGIFAMDSVTGGPYYSYTFRPVITGK